MQMKSLLFETLEGAFHLKNTIANSFEFSKQWHLNEFAVQI